MQSILSLRISWKGRGTFHWFVCRVLLGHQGENDSISIIWFTIDILVVFSELIWTHLNSFSALKTFLLDLLSLKDAWLGFNQTYPSHCTAMPIGAFLVNQDTVNCPVDWKENDWHENLITIHAWVSRYWMWELRTACRMWSPWLSSFPSINLVG